LFGPSWTQIIQDGHGPHAPYILGDCELRSFLSYNYVLCVIHLTTTLTHH